MAKHALRAVYGTVAKQILVVTAKGVQEMVSKVIDSTASILNASKGLSTEQLAVVLLGVIGVIAVTGLVWVCIQR